MRRLLDIQVLAWTALLIPMGFFLIFPARANAENWQDPIEWRSEGDLNGDGVVDSVQVTAAIRMGLWDVRVIVDEAETTYVTEARPGRIRITDIDSTDVWKEVAVHDPGPSDDDLTHFFRFDGERLHHMGVVSGWDVRVDGTGIVQGQRPGRLLQTWHYPALYRVTANGRLRFIRQPLYPMITPVRLRVDLAVRRRPDLQLPTYLIKAGTVGVLSWCDDEGWCEFRCFGADWGWFRVEDGWHIAGLNSSAVFDGLSFAD